MLSLRSLGKSFGATRPVCKGVYARVHAWVRGYLHVHVRVRVRVHSHACFTLATLAQTNAIYS